MGITEPLLPKTFPKRTATNLNITEYLSGAILICILHAKVGKKLRNLIRFPCLNLGIKALNNHLTEPFGRTHNIGRVDRLICTN